MAGQRDPAAPNKPKAHQRRFRPDWCQHHLRRGALAERLVEQSSLGRGDAVLEIGAGRGALTRALARRCASVLAVEIDPGLAARLAAEFAGRTAVRVEAADFLHFPLPSPPYKVFANIPYRHTSSILRRLTRAAHPPDDAYLVLQREAGLRYAGEPFAPERVVSLLLKPWWHAEITARLGPSAFDPPPHVQSVVLWLARRARPLVAAADSQLYRDFVAAGFGRRGETLRASLAPLFTRRQLVRLARDLRFDLQAPPSALGFERWLALFRFFAASASDEAVRWVAGAESRLPRRGER